MTMEQKQNLHNWLNTIVSLSSVIVWAFYAGVSYNRINNHEGRLERIEQNGSPGAVKLLMEVAADVKVLSERMASLQRDLQKHMDENKPKP